MYVLFALCMNTRTSTADIVLTHRGTQSQGMETFHFSLKLRLFHDKIVDSASNVLSALKS